MKNSLTAVPHTVVQRGGTVSYVVSRIHMGMALATPMSLCLMRYGFCRALVRGFGYSVSDLDWPVEIRFRLALGIPRARR